MKISHVLKCIIVVGICAVIVLSVSALLQASSGDTVADRELGQPDFFHNTINIPEADVLSSPAFVAIDKSVSPNRLYVSDTGNSRVLGYSSVAALANGDVADIAIGQPDLYSAGCNNVNSGLGAVSPTSLCSPMGIAVDAAGNLFVADSQNNRVLEYNKAFAAKSATGIKAGFLANWVLGQKGSFNSGACNMGAVSPSAQTLCNPVAVAIDGAGDFYVSDLANNRVLEYNVPFRTAVAAQRVFGQLGSFSSSGANKGGIGAKSLYSPFGVAVDSTGDLYVADITNGRVLEYYTPLVAKGLGGGDAVADVVFGTSGKFNQVGFGTSNQSFVSPSAVALDGLDNLYVADSGNNRVLRFSPPYGSNPVATGIFGQFGDFDLPPSPPAPYCNNFLGTPITPSGASLCGPHGLGLGSTGDLYVADTGDNRVLRFRPPFNSDPVANLVIGQFDMSHDAANSVDPSGLKQPDSVVIDRSVVPNRLYVIDTGNSRILGYSSVMAFLKGGDADLVVGQPDLFSGVANENGSAGQRGLSAPQGAAVDAAGNVFVADSQNNRVLEFIAPYRSGYVANEPALAVFGQGGSFSTNSCYTSTPGAGTLCAPTGVAIDLAHGALYVVDQLDSRVLKFNPPFGPNPVPAVVLGQSTMTAGACNRGLSAPERSTLCTPADVAVDSAGNVYVADEGNSRVLEYSYPPVSGGNAARVFGQGGSFTLGSYCGGLGLARTVYARLPVWGSIRPETCTSPITRPAVFSSMIPPLSAVPAPIGCLARAITLPHGSAILAYRFPARLVSAIPRNQP